MSYFSSNVVQQALRALAVAIPMLASNLVSAQSESPKPIGIREFETIIVFTFENSVNDQGLFSITNNEGVVIMQNEIELVPYGAIFTISKVQLPAANYTVRVVAENEEFLGDFDIAQ